MRLLMLFRIPHGVRFNKEGLSAEKNFAYEREWNGKFYAMKQVRPIFVEEPEGIVVITVYVYYFNTET